MSSPSEGGFHPRNDLPRSEPVADVLRYLAWQCRLPTKVLRTNELISLKLDDEAVGIAVSLRLCLDLCILCQCSLPVDARRLQFCLQNNNNNNNNNKTKFIKRHIAVRGATEEPSAGQQGTTPSVLSSCKVHLSFFKQNFV